MAKRKFHRFIFANEALLGRAALEIKRWQVGDNMWWLGATENSLLTRSTDVMDVITETFGYVDAGTHRNENYAYDKVEPQAQSDKQATTNQP